MKAEFVSPDCIMITAHTVEEKVALKDFVGDFSKTIMRFSEGLQGSNPAEEEFVCILNGHHQAWPRCMDCPYVQEKPLPNPDHIPGWDMAEPEAQKEMQKEHDSDAPPRHGIKTGF